MRTEGITCDWRCPECGAGNRPMFSECWLCQAPRPGTAGIAVAPAAARPSTGLVDDVDDDHPAWEGYSQAQRMLPKYTAVLIIVFFTLLGLVTFGIGLIPLVVLAPVLVRLIRVSRARRAETVFSTRPTWMQVYGTVVAAFAVLLLFVVSSVIAFVVVCAPPGFYNFSRNFENPHPDDFANYVAIAGLVLGVLAAATVPYLIALRLFRKAAGPRMDPREEAPAHRLQARRTAIAILIFCAALAVFNWPGQALLLYVYPDFGRFAYEIGIFRLPALLLAVALTPALFHLFRIKSPPSFEDRLAGSQRQASWAKAVGVAFATVAFTGILMIGVTYVFLLFPYLRPTGRFPSYFDATASTVFMIPGLIVGSAASYIMVRFGLPRI